MEIKDDTELKPAQIKDKIKDMVEHQHIEDIFILSNLRSMLNDPEDNAGILPGIIRRAGECLGREDIVLLQKIEYFEKAEDFEQASLILLRLRVIHEMLILFNLTGHDIQSGQIEKQVQKISIEKFITNLNNKLNKINEPVAIADITDILNNIIRSKSGYSTKGKITIEDIDAEIKAFREGR